MRFLLLTFLATFLVCTSIQAQLELTIVEETRAMSQGSHNALVVGLPGVSEKDAAKIWQKFIKEYKGKVKFDKKSNEYIADDSSIKDMSDNTVDVYAKITANGTDGAEIAVWFNLGVSYLSSNEHAERYPAAEVVLKKFMKMMSADMLEAQIKAQEKVIKDREGELKKLEKEKEGREKDIESYRETIRKAEENIVTAEGDISKNEEDQVAKNEEIEKEKQVLQELQDKLNAID